MKTLLVMLVGVLSFSGIVSGASPTAGDGANPPAPAPAVELDYAALLPDPEFREVFARQMDAALRDYWSQDGDWHGDMMNDATGFAPSLLFKMHLATGEEELYRRAMTTCAFQQRMLGEAMAGQRELDADVMYGSNCFMAGMQYAQEETQRQQFRETLRLGLLMTFPMATAGADGEGAPLDVLAVATAAAFDFHLRTQDDAMLASAKSLLKVLERVATDDEKLLGRGFEAALTLQAYALALRATDDPDSLEAAERLIGLFSQREPSFFPMVGRAYYAAPQKYSVMMSSLMIYSAACWDLYLATDVQRYKQMVQHGLQALDRDFRLDRHYPSGISDEWFGGEMRTSPMFSHHVDVTGSSVTPVESYCVGCNLRVLEVMWDYSRDGMAQQED